MSDTQPKTARIAHRACRPSSAAPRLHGWHAKATLIGQEDSREQPATELAMRRVEAKHRERMELAKGGEP